MHKKPLISAFVCCMALAVPHAARAESFFSGSAGVRSDIYIIDGGEKKWPGVNLNLFFAGQFSLLDNVFIRTEVSLRTTENVTSRANTRAFLKNIPAEFNFDELSLLWRQPLGKDAVNYLSVFMGTYEPTGSDIFLQRQFGIRPISSKLMENHLGLSGSIIYPLQGIGVGDVLHFVSHPIATGLYLYVNSENTEDPDTYVSLNTAFRFACAYPHFTFDLSAGLGMPIGKVDAGGEDVFAIIRYVYLHSGMTMLIGNAQGHSMFIQAGISNVKFKRKPEFDSDTIKDSLWVILEPRFRIGGTHLHFTLFNLPIDTANNSLYLTGTPLGFNVGIYNDNLYARSKQITIGGNLTVALKNNLSELFTGSPEKILSGGLSIAPTVYFSTHLFTGEFNAMLRVEPVVINPFSTTASSYYIDWENLFRLSIGYKTAL
ncbi:MAG: hypothetical protein IJ191_09285 [Treponema sp.]|nr:hypothetical protein [Treponema sp.]